VFFRSWTIGRIAGIDVKVHSTFVILMIFYAAQAYWESRNPTVALAAMVAMAVLFGVVVLHELGHALMARRFGVRTRDITLYPIGGVARLESMPRRPYQELLVAMAGPAVNGVLLGAAVLLRSQVPATRDVELLHEFMTWNLMLGLFNLLPAFPMDGGRVVRALLAMRFDYLRATQTAARLGRFMAFLFGLVGFFGIKGVVAAQPMLVLIAVFIWMAASAEERAVYLEYAARESPFYWFVNRAGGGGGGYVRPGVREPEYHVEDDK
jgi:Zn-dependent protease